MANGSDVQEITFQQALDCTQTIQRDLLLGNGFSIAGHDAFDYRRLLDRASVPDDVRAIFASARTSNFEAVMRILLAEAHGAVGQSAADARRKIEALKRALVESIHEVHPERRNLISADRWAHCETFLEHFIGRKRPGGRIFTTNYDLLLCWAVAPDREIGKNRRLNAYEGFRGGPYDSVGGATIVYLHGALHLARDQRGERQLQYRGAGVALHDQIKAQLERGEYPIFVSEGASSLKEPKSPGFLKDALRAFRGTCNAQTKRALFTLGHGLGPEDAHILGRIAKGRIPNVYLGAFGRWEIDAFHPIARSWVAARAEAGGPSLQVFIFDSTDVVWGPSKTN